MTIPMIRRKIRGFETIEIYPICDLHVGDSKFDEGAYQKAVREILAQENRFVVIGGDIVDNTIIGSVGNVYESKMQPSEQKRYAAELLFPLKDRILSVAGGNHERRSERLIGDSPLRDICSKLNIEDIYSPIASFLKLDIGDRQNGHTRPPHYSICVTHGAGAGIKLGAGINKTETFAISLGVDLVITAHSHKPITAPTVRYECDMAKGVMVQREIRLLIATGWLNYGGYAIEKMYPPVSVRPNKAILNAREHDIAVLS
jgi:predicted phosphodiesterase